MMWRNGSAWSSLAHQLYAARQLPSRAHRASCHPAPGTAGTSCPRAMPPRSWRTAVSGCRQQGARIRQLLLAANQGRACYFQQLTGGEAKAGQTQTHATTARSAPVGAVDGRVRLLVVVQQQHAALGVGAEQARPLADGRLRLHLRRGKHTGWCGWGVKRLACAAQPTGSPRGTRGVTPSKASTRGCTPGTCITSTLIPHLAQRGRLFWRQHQPALCRADGCLAVRQRARHLRKEE